MDVMAGMGTTSEDTVPSVGSALQQVGLRVRIFHLLGHSGTAKDTLLHSERDSLQVSGIMQTQDNGNVGLGQRFEDFKVKEWTR